ncbi:MAG: tripartite tricarboxylate transporter TctB family protein [Pseudomonadota bacterium]
MALDKWIAVFFLLLCLIYGYASFTYPLLPFERNMAFLPNTLPMVLSVAGAALALTILLSPSAKTDEEAAPPGDIDVAKLGNYQFRPALALIAAMILYALALRPVGFLAATTLFLVGTGWILGERKLHVMIPVALIGAATVWFLVQEMLGIFLRPLPGWLS